MSNGLLRGLTLAAFAALGTMTCVASAGAVTAITARPTTLSTFGETYVLTGDPILTSCGTCLVVTNDRITIDLAGRTISGSCGGDGVTDGGKPLQWTTVKNGAIREFDVGINLGSSTRNSIRNIEVSDNGYGLLLGPRSLVKGCLIQRNRQDGIVTGDFVQVQDCTIGEAPPDVGGGNHGNGGGGGIRMLITKNTVVGNQSGILVGDFGTVSFNTASGNTVIGVSAGKHSLVTRNTTNWNGNAGVATGGLSSVSSNISNDNVGGGIGVGVEAWCPSTVTNNQSSGNDYLNYDFNGLGCHDTNNN